MLNPNLMTVNNYRLRFLLTQCLVHYQHHKYFTGVIRIRVKELLVLVDNIYRQMIKFFMNRGYDPLVMDTDGVELFITC